MSTSLSVRVRALVLVVASLCAVVAGGLVFAGAPAFAAGDANEAFCPAETEASPGFRSYLPDCRSYELVTPSFKGGDAFDEGSISQAIVSSDGERVIAPSLGVLAETEGDGLSEGEFVGAIYEMTRGNEGWSISALDPPLSRFTVPTLVSASIDLARTAWLMEEHGHEELGGHENLFVREPGGEFVEVGPTERSLSPTEVGVLYGDVEEIVGADENLDTLLLRVQNNDEQSGSLPTLWPGDPTVTGDYSLYEYTGVHQSEPMMVAVKNEGKLRSNKEAEPITPCGSELGAGQDPQEFEHEGTGYNAISNNGDAVFFTAFGKESCDVYTPTTTPPEVNELYVRVDSEKTLDISEPPLTTPGRICTAGTACETDQTDEAERGSATYQGASAEGTKVFFTTEQPLVTAAEDEGQCLYEEEVTAEGLQSHVKSLALLGCGVEGIVRVSADGSRVYFVSAKKLVGNTNSEGTTASEGAGKDNLYVYDTTQETAQDQVQPVFIATLSSTKDKKDWEPKDSARTAQASLSGGQFLVFSSFESLTAGDESAPTYSQLFEYDAQPSEQFPHGQLRRVSVGYENGGRITSATEEPKLPAQKFDSLEATKSQALQLSQHLAVTEAGSVFFTSEARLTPLALQGGSTATPYDNVYEYENGNVYLISNGQDTAVTGPLLLSSVVQLASVTSSGKDVFFQTADQLVPQDDNEQTDNYYDARIGGSFLAPVVQAPCSESESCQGGGGSPAPSLTSPSSAGYSGGVNLLPPSSPPKAKTRPKSLTRSQKLAKALKACEKKRSKGKRAACERKARKRYGPKKKAETSRLIAGSK